MRSRRGRDHWQQLAGAPVWQYGFAPNTIAELRAELDEKEVWTRPYISFAQASFDQPYAIAVDGMAAHETFLNEP